MAPECPSKAGREHGDSGAKLRVTAQEGQDGKVWSPLGQPSLDMHSGSLETEMGRMVEGVGSGERQRPARARYMGLGCYIQESGLHPEGSGDPLKGQICVF